MNMEDHIYAILVQTFQSAPGTFTHFMMHRTNLNTADQFETTLLHLVASAPLDNLDTVQHLCNLGANINQQNRGGLTALHLAVSQFNYKIVDFLITEGAAMNIQEQTGKTALHLLLDDIWLLKKGKQQGKVEMALGLVNKMLQRGADPNVPDTDGETPLMRAVRQNDFVLFKLMLKFGGSVILHNNDFDTCLHLLLRTFTPNEDILVELLKHKACVNCFGSHNKTAMDLILHYNQTEEGFKTLKLLIKTATLVHWESKIIFELDKNLGFHYLEKFIKNCYTEVSRMKSFTYSDQLNLCYFALNGADSSRRAISLNNLLIEVFETLLKEDFPIYKDLIEAHFNRAFLIKKALEINMYARNEENKPIYLVRETTFELVSHLSNTDLFNLIRAY